MAKKRRKTDPSQFDSIDRKILEQLQTNSKITNTGLSEIAGISPPSTLERVKKLETRGVIQDYVALLDAKLVNQSLLAIVHVSIKEHSADILENAKAKLEGFEEIQSCWYCAGEEDFILKVRVPDMDHYERFVSEKLASVDGIARLRTGFVLDTIKESTSMALTALNERK